MYVTPFSATDVPQAAAEFTGLLMYTRTEGRMAKQAVQCRQAQKLFKVFIIYLWVYRSRRMRL